MLMPKIIDNHELLLKKLMEQPIGKKTILTSTFYPNKVVYNCGCGSTHAVNNPNLKIVGTALQVKFLLACEDGYTSFVQVTGFFIQKAESIWTCETKLFDDVMHKAKIMMDSFR